MHSPLAFIVLCAFLHAHLPASSVVHGTVVINTFLTSCTGIQSALPNLSYAKATKTLPSGVSYCNATAVNTPNVGYLNWYYYDTYPPTPTCAGDDADDPCCHDTDVTTFNFTSTSYTTTSNTFTVTAVGTVISGPFLGATATRVVVTAEASTQCLSPMGLETRSGTVSYAITKLLPLTNLVCTGVLYEEFCPGLRFAP